jgi:hypothetical protein
MSPKELFPKDFEEKSKKQFSEIAKPEVTFQQYLEFEKQEFQRQKQLEKNPKLKYRPAVLHPPATPCGNGDFEIGLDTNEWQGAYGRIPVGGTPDFSTFTSGIVGGPITSDTSHQTWVSVGTDPNVNIPLTAPTPSGTPSLGAVRIGNTAVNNGCELLSKTFLVTSAQSIIPFWYAVVLQDPPHAASDQPFFWVRVIDTASGNEILGLVDFGNGTDKLVADHDNLFFQQKPVPGGITILYKDWACAQINLSTQIGNTVTIQFVTGDCNQTGHWGYAYIDNFCGTCENDPEGNIDFNAGESTNCGPGRLCFTYSLPKIGTTTGSVTIKLDIYQNNQLLTTMLSPTLTSGGNYCFNITQSFLNGLTSGVAGFDFVATGIFAIGSTNLAPKAVGTAPDGIDLGINNDYMVVCDRWCCPGPNLLRNGDFETDTTDFSSQYTYNPAIWADATLAGQYNIVTSAQALAISPIWVATDHFICSGGSGTSKFMVVNGKTCQTGSKIIWKATASVTGGKEYVFCANVKNFKQCTFDITPFITVKFSVPPNVPVPSTITAPIPVITNSSACAWLLIRGNVTVPIGSSSLTIEIWLMETGLGDGNDLALDDISLQLLSTMNPNYVEVNYTTTNIGGGKYNVSANPPYFPWGSPGYGYFWEVCRIDDITGNPIPTIMLNPSTWWAPFPCVFNGYDSTPTSPGIFDSSKIYRITFGAWSDCEAWRQKSFTFKYSKALKKVEVSPVQQSPKDQIPPVGYRGKGVVERVRNLGCNKCGR